MLAALTGLALQGCGSSDGNFFAGPQGPIANPDTYQSLGNAPIQVAAAQGVLANDVPNGGSVTAFDATSANGATVSVGADGSFNYTPVFGFTGADTFNYTVSNAAGSSSNVVTLNLDQRAFFVDNTAPGGGNGSFTSRFNSLAAGLAAAGVNDTIFVFRGNGTNTNLAGAFALQAGQRLIGEGTGLIPQEGVVVVPAGNAPVLQGPGTLASGNTVQGLILDGSPADALQLSAAVATTINDNLFRNVNSTAIDLDNVSGQIAINRNIFNDVVSNIVDINNTDLNSTIEFNNNQGVAELVSTSDVLDIDVNGTSQTTVNASANTFSTLSGRTYSDGILINGSGTTVTNATLTNNSFANVNNESFEIDTETSAQVTASLTGNTADGAGTGTTALEVDTAGASSLALTLASNNFFGHGGAGTEIDTTGDSNVTVVATNNTFSGNGNRGVALLGTANSFVRAAFRNNTLTGNTGDDLRFETTGTARVDLDITGNIATIFNFIRGAGTAMNVERLDGATGGPLTAPVNTVTTVNQAGGPTPVNPGFVGL